MPKKLTYEYVKNYIESFEGYKLLSEEYKNSYTKLKVKCPKNHVFEIKQCNFKSGNRCYKCNYEDKRNNYEDVKYYIEGQGYELLSKEYKNSMTKLSIKCSEGHTFEMIWNNFKRGERCPECYGNKKYDINKVKNYIEEQGYELLSKEYKNSMTKLRMQCPKGHIFEMSFNSFKNSGKRCPECAGNKKINNQEIINTLSFCENIRENENEEIEVTCTYCGE